MSQTNIIEKAVEVFNSLLPENQSQAVTFMLFLKQQQEVPTEKNLEMDQVNRIGKRILQEHSKAFEELAK